MKVGSKLCLATGLGTSLSFEGVLGICHLDVFLFHQCKIFFAMKTRYATDDIGRGAREVISDLDGSLGSRHFLYVLYERTSFAS